VVTSFEFHSIRSGTVTGGLIAHPFDRARDLLKFFRDSTASLPDEHMIFGVSFMLRTARARSWRPW